MQPCHIGNDVVDLTNQQALPRARFVERICAESELSLLAAHDPPWFWAMFAAKEAAFKALKKSSPCLAFVPRNFVVQPSFASVRHAAVGLELIVTVTPRWVHALAQTQPGEVAWRVAELGPDQTESEEARRLLREVAAEDARYAQAEFELVRMADPNSWDGRGSPAVHVRGRRVGADASLSHDGRFVACAFRAEHA